MSCITPITLVRDYRTMSGEFTNVVPCGRCPQCLQRRQSGWIFRLKKEKEVSETSAFLTLTYDDEHIKRSFNGHATLNVRDHQLFMKRLRKEIKTYSHDNNKRVRYYSCGEYGAIGARPHMHSIIFDVPNLILDNPEHLAYIWRCGNVRIDPCNGATISYVSKYIMKQIKLNDRQDDDDRVEEFSLMSKGMGKNYLSQSVVGYYQKKQIPYLVLEGGKKMAMPRYYQDKIYTKLERFKIAQKALEFVEENNPFDTEWSKLQWSEHQYKKQKRKVQESRNKL